MFSFTFNQVSVFFYGFKSQLSNSYDNWYVQKYLEVIFYKGMFLIYKEYITRAILSFSSPRCAIIACLNVIYTKFRRAMIAQPNKIWWKWACAHAIAHHSRPGLHDVFFYWTFDLLWINSRYLGIEVCFSPHHRNLHGKPIMK